MNREVGWVAGAGGIARTTNGGRTWESKEIEDPSFIKLVGNDANTVWAMVENVSTYASNLSYRAWGALKDVDYGNGVHSHTDFNPRFLPTSAALSNLYGNSSMSWSYDYFDDARLHHAYDAADHTFDRSQEYDQVGRIKEAYSGREVKWTVADVPGRQSLSADLSIRRLEQSDGEERPVLAQQPIRLCSLSQQPAQWVWL